MSNTQTFGYEDDLDLDQARDIELQTAITQTTTRKRIAPGTIAATAVLALTLAGTGAAIPAIAGINNSASPAITADEDYNKLHAATSQASQKREEYTALIEDAKTAQAAAQSALDASGGRVLTEENRTALADAIAALGEDIQDGENYLASSQLKLRKAWEKSIAKDGDVDAYVLALASIHFPYIDLDLTAELDAVAADIDAWNAEQERLAAEAEAARLAEEARQAEAAAQQSASKSSGSNGKSSGGSSSAAPAAPAMLSVNIWTTGGQAQVDARKGAVNFAEVARYLGGGFYAAEHWSSGGHRWQGVGVGTQVSFAGYGIYEVVSISTGMNQNSVTSLPKGLDGYFQTCWGGDLSYTNMYVFGLRKVG